MGQGWKDMAVRGLAAWGMLAASCVAQVAQGIVGPPPGPPCPTPAAQHASRCAKPPGCPPPCDPLPEYPPPTWYVRLQALILKRDADRDVVFATLGDPNAVALDTDDLDFPFQGGGEIFVGRMIVPTHYLEFSYFGINSWDETAAVRDESFNALGGSGNLYSPFGDFGADPISDFDYNNFASVAYESRLNNFEVNCRHDLPMPPIGLNTSFLFGGRAMLIEEDLDYLTRAAALADILPARTNRIGTGTENRLLGLQIGGLFEFHIEPCWWIDFEILGAICQNEITLDSRYQRDDVLVADFRRDDSQTAFVGDLSLSLVYECSRWLTTEIGYRALWITGLALAAENLQTDPEILTLGPPQLVDDGEVVYHGPHVGVTVRW